MEATASVNRRMLIPLDGSMLAEQAVPYALALASPGSELVLLHVLPGAEPVTGARGEVVAAADEVTHGVETTVREELAALARRLVTRQDVPVGVETAVGDPAARILDVARDRAATMIVLASHGRGAIGRWTFGSVADRVARSSAVPVVIVRPQDAPVEAGAVGVRRLVVPLDGSPTAAQAVPVASALARALRLPILLVTAVDPSQAVSPIVGYGAAFSDAVYQDLVAQLTSDARALVEQTGARLIGAGVTTDWQILVGPPAAAIMDATVGGDLIVMTSHGRSGLSRWLIGSVAEKLVRQGPVPVMIVRAAAGSAPA